MIYFPSVHDMVFIRDIPPSTASLELIMKQFIPQVEAAQDKIVQIVAIGASLLGIAILRTNPERI